MSEERTTRSLRGPSGGTRAWIIWGMGALTFTYAFVQRVSPSVMIDQLMADLMVSGAVLGNLTAFYFYAYAGLQVPVGMMLDRFGPRRMIPAALLLAAGGSMIFSQAVSVEAAYLGRLLVGIGVAFGYVGSLKLATNWFAPRRFALLSGLTMAFGMLGGILGQTPIAALVEATSWRQSMFILGIVAAVLAVIFWLVVRDNPASASDAIKDPGPSPLRGLGIILSKRQNWLLALTSAAMTAPMLALAGFWGVAWLMQVHDLTRAEASAVSSSMFIGWGLGSPVAGWLSDRYGRPKVIMQSFIVIALISLSAMLYLPIPTAVILALLAISGFTLGGMVTGFALARYSNPVSVTGAAYAFVNMAVTGTGALFLPLIGWLLDLSWDGVMHEGVRIYDATGYTLGFSVLPAFLVLGLLATLWIKEDWIDES